MLGIGVPICTEERLRLLKFLLVLFSQDHDLIISLSWDKLFAGDLIIATTLLLSQDNEIIKFWSWDNRPNKIISNYGCSQMDSVHKFFPTNFHQNVSKKENTIWTHVF